jgi:putative heme-binding domain-containing protein
MWLAIPNAHFTRMYGDDLNPYVFAYMKSCVDHLHWGGGHWTSSRNTGASGGKTEHSEAGGGHAHTGCLIYQGDNFPPEYRNSVFMCNIHGNRLNRDRLDRSPDGYVGKHEKDFLLANDSWFRGLALKQGPDGSLFVSDWTDTGECHNYKEVDLKNGRVFKVSYGTPKPFTGDVSKLSDMELVVLQTSDNEWLVRHARRVLQERAEKAPIDSRATLDLRDVLEHSPLATKRLRAAWALYAIGKLSDGDVSILSRDSDPGVRVATAQIGLDRASPSKNVQELVGNLADDVSPFVRRIVAGHLQRLAPEIRNVAIAKLLGLEADRETALMIWYGIQPNVISDPAAMLPFIRTTKIGLIREHLVRGYLTRPSVDLKVALDDVVKVLGSTVDDPARKQIIGGIQLTVAGRKDLTPPVSWAGTYAKLQKSTDPGVRYDSEALAVQFGDAKAIKAVRARITDTAVAADLRQSAVRLLVAKKIPDLGPTLRQMLSDPAVRTAALKALSSYPDPETAAAILKVYATLTPEEKADAVQTLASRPAFANALLDAVEKGEIPRTDIPVVAARQMFALNDKTLAARLTKVWGSINPVGKNRAALLAKWKPQLDVAAIQKADAGRGRAVFGKSCAACHKIFGEGGDVGPDLTGSQRANLDYLLENVLDPNAIVAREFRMVNFVLADGRSVGGIVQRENDAAVTVRTVNETLVIAKADIETRKDTNQSIMPEGLFDALKPDEVRDLVAYLASKEQVPAK